MEPLKIFIGYEPHETIAWHTLTQSIIEQTSQPVSIIPLGLQQMAPIHHRPRDPRQSNDFTYTRFLVPYLCGFQGKALFVDCDMMFRADPAELFTCDERYAVNVVKHSYEPRDEIKYLGTRQYAYPRKNWSSVMLWNCSHPENRVLTPHLIDNADPKYLHRFQWLKDNEIGEIDVLWNWLVGEYEQPPEDVKNVHWTVGGPYFQEYRDVDFAEEWRALKKRTVHVTQLEDLESGKVG